MQELLVILEENVDRETIRAVATIVWESELLPMISVMASDDQVGQLKRLPGVKHIEPPRTGSLMT